MVHELIRINRSYRRFYQDVRIGQVTMEELVDNARMSASGGNLQPLKYMISITPDRNETIFSHLRWAAYLKDWEGPKEGEKPSGYIVILGDREIKNEFSFDAGIACQSILLGACEKGLGGCIIANIDKAQLVKKLNISERYELLAVIALGKPREEVILEELEDIGSVKYWRDENQVHHVPKRKLKDILL